MQHVTFVTGNAHKAAYLAQYLWYPVDHIHMDLDEIQSTDLYEIVEHKVRQAYQKTQKPVIVEDVSLEFHALGGLPGPFIKFFVEKTSLENICAMIPQHEQRKATARCVFGYCDDQEVKLFEWYADGEIATEPTGDGGYGWDKIFIPQWYGTTRAALSPADYQLTYLQIKPFAQLKDFLDTK